MNACMPEIVGTGRKRMIFAGCEGLCKSICAGDCLKRIWITSPFMRIYLQEIDRFLVLLLLIQIGRALIIIDACRILQPASVSPLWAYMDMADQHVRPEAIFL